MAIRESVLGYFLAGDHGLMRKVNRWTPPRWLRLWMLGMSRAGDGWLWFAAGIGVLLFGGVERWAALEAGALAAVAAIVLFQALKRLARRRRPREFEPHCWAELLPPDRFSFPSGHSMTAFAVSASLSVSYPALAPFLLLCAVGVAASRILLGMHFLTDVVAGSTLGILLAYAARAALL